MAIAYAMDDLDMYLPSNVAKRIKILKEPDYSGEVITRDEEVAETSPSTVRIVQQEDPDMKQGIGALYKST
jgi:hypothetical protein